MKIKVKMLIPVLIWGFFTCGVHAGLFGLFNDNDEKINIKELPPAVIQAIQRVFPQGEMKRAEKEVEGNKISYEVKVESGEILYSIETAADGTMIKVERKKGLKKDDDEDDGKEIKASDLPQAVRAAAVKTFPNGAIKEADCKTKSGRIVYEVEVKDSGVEHIVLVSADGTVLGIVKEDGDKD